MLIDFSAAAGILPQTHRNPSPSHSIVFPINPQLGRTNGVAALPQLCKQHGAADWIQRQSMCFTSCPPGVSLNLLFAKAF